MKLHRATLPTLELAEDMRRRPGVSSVGAPERSSQRTAGRDSASRSEPWSLGWSLDGTFGKFTAIHFKRGDFEHITSRFALKLTATDAVEFNVGSPPDPWLRETLVTDTFYFRIRRVLWYLAPNNRILAAISGAELTPEFALDARLIPISSEQFKRFAQ